MKYTFIFIACSLTLLACLSCNKQERLPVSWAPETIGAVYSELEDAETKNSVVGISWPIKWSSGDEIAVVNLTTGSIAKYQVQSAYVGQADAKFDYVSGTVGEGEIVAVYPYSSVSYEDGILYVELEDEVVYNANGSYAPGEKPAFATNDIQITNKLTPAQLTNVLTFNRVVSLITVYAHVAHENLIGQVAHGITLQSPGITGKSAVSFDGSGKPSVIRGAGPQKTDRVYCALTSAPVLSNTNYPVRFIPVFPYRLDDGFYFIFTTDDYEVGLCRKASWNSSVNYNANYYFFEAAATPVQSQDNAIFNLSWWYNSRPAEDESTSGAFDNGIGYGGNNAGGFQE